VSQEDVELVRAGFAALRDGGVDALLPFVHPEFEVSTPPEFAAEPDTYRGVEGIRRYFESFYEAMDEIRFEPREFIESRGRVIAPVTLTAQGRTTGIETHQEFVMVWTLRDRKIVRIHVFATLEEATAAVERGSLDERATT
jgi:ketosteroid isomerase-like protein